MNKINSLPSFVKDFRWKNTSCTTRYLWKLPAVCLTSLSLMIGLFTLTFSPSMTFSLVLSYRMPLSSVIWRSAVIRRGAMLRRRGSEVDFVFLNASLLTTQKKHCSRYRACHIKRLLWVISGQISLFFEHAEVEKPIRSMWARSARKQKKNTPKIAEANKRSRQRSRSSVKNETA